MKAKYLGSCLLLMALMAAFSLAAEDAPIATPETPPPPTAAESAPRIPSDTAIPVTVEELRTLLARKEMPRIAVANRFGGRTTGKAVRVDEGKIYLDVTGEGVAIGGILSFPLSRIESVNVFVSLSPLQIAAAEKASAEYLAELKAEVSPPAQPPRETTATAQPVQPDQPSQTPESVRDLLQIYPPSEGWGPGRVAEITRKRVVLHLQPFGKERTFLTDSDAWREAYNLKRQEQLAEKARLEAAGAAIPEDFVVLPELPPVEKLAGAPPQEPVEEEQTSLDEPLPE